MAALGGRRKRSVSNIERMAMLPRRRAADSGGDDGAECVLAPALVDKACTGCGSEMDAFSNPLYSCSSCMNRFCHQCVPPRPLQAAYARICDRCYKNLRGMARGHALEIGLAGKLSNMFEEAGKNGALVVAPAEKPPQRAKYAVDHLSSAVEVYMAVPTPMLCGFLEYFEGQETLELERLSRWYESKVARLKARIADLESEAALAEQGEKADVAAIPLKHATKRRPKRIPGSRRLPTRRSPRASVSSSSPEARSSSATTHCYSNDAEEVDEGKLARAAAEAALRRQQRGSPKRGKPAPPVAAKPKSKTKALSTVDSSARTPRKEPPPVAPKRHQLRPPSEILDSDHPLHDDISHGIFTNPLADTAATLRGAPVLSPTDRNLWIHSNVSREAAEDMLLTQDTPGSWLIRTDTTMSTEVVELVYDTGTGAPHFTKITRDHRGQLLVDGVAAGTAGTVRALIQELSDAKRQKKASLLPIIDLKYAILRPMDHNHDVVNLVLDDDDSQDNDIDVDTFGGYESEEEVAEGFGSDVDDDGDLDVDATRWLHMLPPSHVHRGVTAAEAEEMLLLEAKGVGSWILRIVGGNERWLGSGEEVELLVDTGNETEIFRISQCQTTKQLVIDGRWVSDDDCVGSFGGLCATALGVRQAHFAPSKAILSVVGDAVWLHRGIDFKAACATLFRRGEIGSWLVYTPGRNNNVAELLVDTGGSLPTVISIYDTAGGELCAVASMEGEVIPDIVGVDLEHIVWQLSDPGQQGALDLHLAVAASHMDTAAAAGNRNSLYLLLDDLLDSQLSKDDFQKRVADIVSATSA